MSQKKELSPKQFRKMQLVELEMLVDFDRVCRKHNINYVIYAGTLLGSIRHKGFIPWDDDADIAMLREDYEKFKKYIGELNPNICYFQDHTTDKEYRWGYGKLRRTGTEYVRLGQEHLKCKTGIFVDIFPLDDIPKTLLMQIFQDIRCFFLRKVLYSEVGKYNSKGLTKLIYGLLSKIPTSRIFKKLKKYADKSSNSTKNDVRVMMYTAVGKLYRKHKLKDRFGLKKEWYLNRKEYIFEGHKFYGPADYDGYLTYVYGDYMELPPVEKRQQHAPFSKIKFPEESKERKQYKNDKKISSK